MTDISDIRRMFVDEWDGGYFVTDKSGVRTIELIGSSFVASEGSIFGVENMDYVKRELAWYTSQSLYIADIPGKTPAIWEQVASSKGEINSNYGYLIYNGGNGSQYDNVLAELRKNPDSRRAIMIYTRPSMHRDYNRDGMSDFVCTNTVQYLIREGKLHAVVNMRSNDAIFGYRNDWHWQHHVLLQLAMDLKVSIGRIKWQTGSLHIYERHFYLVEHYARTGETHISKEDFDRIYGPK